MTKQLNRVGIGIALVIPALRYLSPDALRSSVAAGEQVARWLVLSIVFLLIWFLNNRLYAVFMLTSRASGGDYPYFASSNWWPTASSTTS